jgi:hypothetical protein
MWKSISVLGAVVAFVAPQATFGWFAAPDLLETPFVTDGGCGECTPCMAGQHSAAEQQGGTLGSLHSYCINTLCAHPACEGGGGEVPGGAMLPHHDLFPLIDGVVAGRPGALEELLRNAGARWNPDRNAVQVESPCGSILAHIPLLRGTAVAQGLAWNNRLAD